MQEAIDEAKAMAKEVSGYYIEVPEDSLDEAEVQIKKMDKLGLSPF